MRVELHEVDFSGDQKDERTDRGQTPVAAGLVLGRQGPAVQGVEKPIGQAMPGHGHDARPRDGHGHQTGSGDHTKAR